MSNWQIIDAPMMAPHKCITCPAFSKRVIDTKVDIAMLPDGGRVYQCQNCSKQAALLWGFAKGEKMAELENAAEQLEQRGKEVAQLQVALRDRDRLLEDLQVKNKTAEEELTRERQKVDQLRAGWDEIGRVAGGIREATA